MASGAIPVVIGRGPSIASASTAEGEGLTGSTAGKRAYFYLQSRDWDGLPVDNPADGFDIVFTGPAEGTPAGQDGTFSVVASYLENGKQLAEYIPRYAGTYVLAIKLPTVDAVGEYLLERISGSDWTMVVKSGEIAPTNCLHDIPDDAGDPPVDITAGITHFFSLTLKDMYGNLIPDARDNTAIAVTARYVDHDAWDSPIGVEDLLDWDLTYGTDVSGLAVFDNSSFGLGVDSIYASQITIYRAGTFTLDLEINGVHISGSPLTEHLAVKPAGIYAPTSIVQGHVLEMIAGDTYTAQIQSRDFFSNNKKELLATAALAWDARIVELDPSGESNATVMCEGTIEDNTGNPGVFDYTFTPLYTGANYRI